VAAASNYSTDQTNGPAHFLRARTRSARHLQYMNGHTRNGPAHFLRARTRSARHLQYMNGHTRKKRVMKRASNAVMTRECHADVRMLCKCCANVTRRCTDEARFICATFEQQMRCKTRFICATFSSKCDVKLPAHYSVAPDVRSALHSMGYFWSVYTV
jgi:hypothetical protein